MIDTLTYENAASRFVHAIPEMKTVYDDENKSMGYVSNYAMFSVNIKKFMIRKVVSLRKAEITTHEFRDLFSRIFEFIEQMAVAAKQDHDLRELILTGFIEQIYTDDEYFPVFVSWMQPTTLYFVDRYSGKVK